MHVQVVWRLTIVRSVIRRRCCILRSINQNSLALGIPDFADDACIASMGAEMVLLSTSWASRENCWKYLRSVISCCSVALSAP